VGFHERGQISGRGVCYIIDDSWNDYGYRTLCGLIWFDQEGKRTELGSLKIMEKGMERGRVQLESSFLTLGPSYASLGTDQSYYENLIALDPEISEDILTSLRDAIWDVVIFEEFAGERAFADSLMRGIRKIDIRKFGDILRGRAELTPFEFEYEFPEAAATGMHFKVIPHLLPPTNIHTIIGRNGVGKTRLIRSLTRLLCEGEVNSENGRLKFLTQGDEVAEDGTFANLINVAFSAFDRIELPNSSRGTKTGIRVSYIGLRRPVDQPSLETDASGNPVPDNRDDQGTQLKSIEEMTNEFVGSCLTCIRSSRRRLWLETMEILESDPLFATMDLQALPDWDDSAVSERAKYVFRDASAGHKIVLLCLTRLVELVEERTLVLIDEPEAHLHPPLQASFIRALSNLLTSRNGAGILATHSPVMLQEVPQDCVWLLFREGQSVSYERPQIETFAENLGILTREVFRLEVTQSGYHTLLAEAAMRSDSLEEVFERFRSHLGTEGRAMARVLWKDLHPESEEI
jgi:predicted ATPase